MSSTFPPPESEPEPEPTTTESKPSRYGRRKAITEYKLLPHNQKKPLTNEELREKHFRSYMSDADNNPRIQLGDPRIQLGEFSRRPRDQYLTEEEIREIRKLSKNNRKGGKRTRKLKKRKTRKHKKKNKRNTRK
jgi:hypothetical protein